MLFAQTITDAIINNTLLGMVMFVLLQFIIKRSKWENSFKFSLYLFSLVGLTIFFISAILISIFLNINLGINIFTALPNALLSKAQYFLSIVYIIGATLIFCYQGWQLFKLKAIAKLPTSKTPIAIKLFLEKQAIVFGIGKKVTLIISNKIDAIFTVGHLKPIIYLPFQLMLGLTENQLEALLTHELAHIKRNDYFWNIVIIVCKAILFFNPLAWWLQKQLQHERELASDNWVTGFYYSPIQYAETLLHLQRTKPALSLAIGFASDGFSLTHRIKSILNPQEAYFSKFQKSGWAMFLGCALLYFFTAPNIEKEIKPKFSTAYKYKKKAKTNFDLNFDQAKNNIVPERAKDIKIEKLSTATGTALLPHIENEIIIENDLPLVNVSHAIEENVYSQQSFAENLLQKSQATYLKTNYNNTLDKINALFEDIDNDNAKEKSIKADSIIKAEFLKNTFTANIFINNKKPVYSNFGKPIRLNSNSGSADSAFVVSYNRLQVVYNQIKNTTQNIPTDVNQLYYYNIKEAEGLCMVKFYADALSKTITPQMYFYHLPTKKLYLLFHNKEEEFIMVPLKNEVL